ncbi:30S ribosomal protein S9 [Actinosynnema sp. NPDC020468]|uniref:30S ribosomal protein S9 n=1 Tax=Actinosynnema sp. NPDC020468 TaxID=3154488 RepID=UPI0033D33DD7
MTEQHTEDIDVTTPEVDVDEATEAEAAVDTPEDTATEVEATEAADVEADSEEAVSEESDSDEAGDEEAEAAPVVRHQLNGAHHLAQTVGRRKEAIVRVRLLPGTGKFTLNGKTLEAYFPNKVHQQLIREPLVTTEKPETFDVIANLRGGGTTGQAGALRLAIARALIAVDSEDRPVLKKAGFLTRDPRVKERKKYGLKKARKAPQYSKR